ncbi:DUF397 domain-containing protein [Actinomadura sp. GC306]|uniref:DUF397 domain-containing protein n=1 Tax=Actinomadura sp. GC306 TaxID=2530367 RepID=UPI001047E11C|nr:DUF397 domain-containing protein [Actinomadura sp. GC306]TDC68089.1 DUF397 domain-containing protein [Actinomadura sp. GC306]
MTRKFTDWRVSSYSEAGGNCVEVGCSTSDTIGIRDSKMHGKGPILKFTRTEWIAFLESIRSS